MASFGDIFKKEIRKNAAIALEHLDEEIVGYEEQERGVEKLVNEFCTSKKGQCCLLEGEPNCGRESVLRKVLDKAGLELRVINVGFIAADPTYQDSLAHEIDDEFSVFLIRDADELLSAHQQEFLYTMVDKATHSSWLVFFSITRHNFAQKLEKRGNSRMPKIRICFHQSDDFEAYCTNFRMFLTSKNAEYSDQYKQLVRRLPVEKWLKTIYEKYNYDVLKQVAAQILSKIAYSSEEEALEDDSDNEKNDKLFKDVVGFALPGFNRKIELLQDQTLRSRCVFLCVHRLLFNKSPDGSFLTPQTTYRTVFLEFKKLANKAFKLLDVSSDVFIFREIDHLIDIGLVRGDRNSNATNTSFRKVWLDMDPVTVQSSLKLIDLPSFVSGFFDTTIAT